jgi:hypothetical protein
VPHRRLFNRKSSLRDSKLFVIACEGNKTECEYFDHVFSKFRSSKIHIELLRRHTTRSAPEYVLEELDNFNREYELSLTDELWAVIDYDRWGDKKIRDIAQKINQKGYHLALSNPCFEVWKLLHLVNIDEYNTEKKQKLLESSQNVKTELAKIHRSINNSIDLSAFYLEGIDQAIKQAIKLDTGDRWPNSFGTHVYKLFISIRKSL